MIGCITSPARGALCPPGRGAEGAEDVEERRTKRRWIKGMLSRRPVNWQGRERQSLLKKKHLHKHSVYEFIQTPF